MQIANKRHDVIAVMIDDPREKEFPPVGIVELEDSETGENILIDTNDQYTRKEYSVLNTTHQKNVIKKFNEDDIPTVMHLININNFDNLSTITDDELYAGDVTGLYSISVQNVSGNITKIFAGIYEKN